MLVVDAHLDLAMNALMWNRDLALSAHETRRHRARGGDDGQGAWRGDGRLPGPAAGRDRAASSPRSSPARTTARIPTSTFAPTRSPSPRRRGSSPTTRSWSARGSSASSAPPPTSPAWLAAWDADPASAPFGFVILMEGRRPDRGAGPGAALVGRRAAHGRAGPLRSQRLRLRHRQRRAVDGEGARAAAGDGRSWG